MFVFGNRCFGIASVSSSNVKKFKKNNRKTSVEGKINSPVTSVRKNEVTSHNIAEEQRSLQYADWL
jgi:hypothetical protein